MERPAEIGTSIVVKGTITAKEDLVISGRVDGSITVEGHSVTVTAGAALVADVQARAIVVSGQVLGAMCADELIELRQSADVEGELSAPAFRMNDGAVFNGKAETLKSKAPKKSGLQLAS